jgi:hypothetical protein
MQVLEARYPLVTLSSITTIILHHVPSLFFPHHLSTIIFQSPSFHHHPSRARLPKTVAWLAQRKEPKPANQRHRERLSQWQ